VPFPEALQTCRLCGVSNFEPHKYPLIRYGRRHSAHADCGLDRWGAKFFDRLRRDQLESFPALAAIDAGLEAELRQVIAGRGGDP
jgi:hypothetical protein